MLLAYFISRTCSGPPVRTLTRKRPGSCLAICAAIINRATECAVSAAENTLWLCPSAIRSVPGCFMTSVRDLTRSNAN